MRPESPRTRNRRIAAVVGAALVLHGLLALVFDQITVRWRLTDGPAVASDGAAPDEPTPTPSPGPIDVSVVALVDLDRAPPPLAVWGPGDLAGFAATHPLPNASIDRPGERAADRGGGEAGGATLWTGRRDRLDDATLLAEPWNDGADYRAAHDRTGARSSSTEALHRQPDPAAGDREVQRLARDGGEVASHGTAPGIGAASGDALWRDADPKFGLKPGREQDVREGGATRPNHEVAFTDQGTASADVTTRGARTRDRESVAAASNQTMPDPYDLTPVSSGGDARGVRGEAGDGAIEDGTGTGDGATTANAARGRRDLAVKATPQDPYFRELFTRLAKAITFPRDLAIDLRSGRPVVAFVLASDGKISDIRLHASSGFRGFDTELLRAVTSLGDLAAPPARLLGGNTRLRVLVPFKFQNPIVR